MGEPVIRVEGLGKRYRIGERERYLALRDALVRWARAPLRALRRAGPDSEGFLWALKDVSFEVPEGEVLGIIGRNGAGKTTLLKILARVTSPTEGRAVVRGRVGSLLEVGTGFHPELTGRENVYLSGAILGMSRREIDGRFEEIVDFAGVERFIDTPLKRYSAGMQTRLAFAVAAHLEPDILLVDEVLAVGDLEFQRKCLGKMEDVGKSGRTVVFVSHQMNQIRRLCQRVLWLDAGQIRRSGPTHEVVSTYEAAITSGEWLRAPKRPDVPRTKARFLKWEILSPRNDQPNTLTELGPVTIRFLLEVNEQIQHGHHGVALFNSEGQLIWASAASNLKLSRGVHELLYTFPLLPLRPGAYTWHVSLYADHGPLDVWYSTPELLIATQSYQHPSDIWNGILNLPSRFAVAQLSDET